jgi:hypothetical protein
MKNISVVLLAILALVFSAYAEAAKPRKRTRNANRVGAYAIGAVGFAKFTSDVADDEAAVFDVLSSQGLASRNVEAGSEVDDLGYQAIFGFRFNRYFAAELGLLHIGEMASIARGELDYGDGFLPANLSLSFSAGGPLMSVIGILPVNDKFEVFARAGYLFTSAEREFLFRVDGETAGFGSSKGDSQDLVIGAGGSFHFNQVYSMRLEYLLLDGIGEEQRSGTEDANIIGLGFVVRF